MTDETIKPHGVCDACLSGRSLPLLGTGETFAVYCFHSATLAIWAATGRWTETHPIDAHAALEYVNAHAQLFIAELQRQAASDDNEVAFEANRRLALVGEWRTEIERVFAVQRGPAH